MGGKEKEGRVGGRGKGGEGKGERMWRGPESGLPRGPCWLLAGLFIYQAAARDCGFVYWCCPSVLFVCLLVTSVCRQAAKNAIFSKTKQFRAMVINDL